MSCRSLDEFIPGSIAVPSPSSTCVYGPVWNGEKPREIHLPLKTAQPYGCKATVSCVTPVRNSLVANILFCDKNGNWVPNEYEIAMGRSLLPDCQSAIEMEEELDEKLKPSRGNQFWNEAPQAHDQQ